MRTGTDTADRARVIVRFGADVVAALVSVVALSGVVAVSVAAAGALSLVVGGGGVTVGTGCVLAGASCAPIGVEESAKTAAIAVAPARAYSFMVVVIMRRQPLDGLLGVSIIVTSRPAVDE